MIEIGISAVALLLSALAYFETRRQSSISMRLSEQEIELVRQQLAANRSAVQESRQANVSARMYKDRNNWRVRVFNAGPSDAKNVRLLLNEYNHLVTSNAIQGKFPMERMEKGQSVDFWARVHMSSPLKELLVIRWDDLSDSDRENRVEITV